MKLFKSFYLLTAFLLLSKISSAVHLYGELLNCKGKVLKITSDTGDFFFEDSMSVSQDGGFDYRTDRITQPGTFRLNTHDFSFSLFLAPGYDLHVSTTTGSEKMLMPGFVFTGVGAVTNSYWSKLYKINSGGSWQMPIGDFNATIESLQLARTEIVKDVFSENNHDPYKEFFRQTALYETYFQPLFSFLFYCYQNNFSKEETKSVVREFYSENELKAAVDDKFLVSPTYCWLLTKLFWELKTGEHRQKSSDTQFYDSVFATPTKTRDFLLYKDLDRRLQSVNKMDELLLYKSYIQKIKNPDLIDYIYNKWGLANNVVSKFDKGKELPDFVLFDENEKECTLEKFRGKYVLIDFWASWCGPCIASLTDLKYFYDKSIDKNKVEFLGIAISDSGKQQKRKEILRDAGVTWPQLEDRSGELKRYLNVDFIPRLVLIAPDGTIVDAEFVYPDNKAKFRERLNKALLTRE